MAERSFKFGAGSDKQVEPTELGGDLFKGVSTFAKRRLSARAKRWRGVKGDVVYEVGDDWHNSLYFITHGEFVVHTSDETYARRYESDRMGVKNFFGEAECFEFDDARGFNRTTISVSSPTAECIRIPWSAFKDAAFLTQPDSRLAFNLCRILSWRNMRQVREARLHAQLKKRQELERMVRHLAAVHGLREEQEAVPLRGGVRIGRAINFRVTKEDLRNKLAFCKSYMAVLKCREQQELGWGYVKETIYIFDEEWLKEDG